VGKHKKRPLWKPDIYGRIILRWNGSQGQTERAVALQEEEEY
jgi:hypothetical protein